MRLGFRGGRGDRVTGGLQKGRKGGVFYLRGDKKIYSKKLPTGAAPKRSPGAVNSVPPVQRHFLSDWKSKDESGPSALKMRSKIGQGLANIGSAIKNKVKAAPGVLAKKLKSAPGAAAKGIASAPGKIAGAWKAANEREFARRKEDKDKQQRADIESGKKLEGVSNARRRVVHEDATKRAIEKGDLKTAEKHMRLAAAADMAERAEMLMYTDKAAAIKYMKKAQRMEDIANGAAKPLPAGKMRSPGKRPAGEPKPPAAPKPAGSAPKKPRKKKEQPNG